MNKRDQYVDKLKFQLDVWNAEVSKWEAKAQGAQADMRAEYEKRIEAFRRQRDQGLEQIRKVQGASGDAWVELTRGADEAWVRMREAFEKAQSHFQRSDTNPGRTTAPNTNPGRTTATGNNPDRTTASR